MGKFSFYTWPNRKTTTTTSKRGRPKSQKPIIDYGTPELQVKRKMILGKAASSRLSMVGLDVLYAHNLVNKNQRYAGFIYARICYAAKKVTLAPRIARINFDIMIKGRNLSPNLFPEDEIADKAVEQRWLKVREILQSLGYQVFWIIENIVVYDEITLIIPQLNSEANLGRVKQKLLKKLRFGLSHLYKYFCKSKV